MDSNLQLPIPFPTLSRQAEEPEKALELSTAHSRVHSSPTSPNPWLLSYPRSKKKLSVTSTGSPRRSHIPLTPPLTPSSSFNSGSGNDFSDRDNDAESNVPSTPPESPLRAAAWNSASSKWKNGGGFGGVYLSPVSAESDSGAGDLTLRRMRSASNLSSASPAGSVDSITPRLEKTFRMDSADEEDELRSLVARMELCPAAHDILTSFKGDGQPSRFVLLRNIPPQAPSHLLKSAFSTTGDVKGILVRFQESHGVVILAYFDVRHALRARQALHGQRVTDVLDVNSKNQLESREDEEDAKVEAICVSAEQLERVIEKSVFVASTSGMFFTTVKKRVVSSNDVRNVLSGFGDLMVFSSVGSAEQQKFRVEYWDVRESERAYNALKDRAILGALFLTSLHHEQETDAGGLVFPSVAAGGTNLNEVDLTSPVKASVNLPLEEYKRRPRSVSVGESMGSPDAMRARQRDVCYGRGREREREASLTSQEEFTAGRVRSVGGYDRNEMQPPPSPSRRRSISMGPEPDREDVLQIPSPTGVPHFAGLGRWPGPANDSGLAVSNGYHYDQQQLQAPVPPYASQYPPPHPHTGYQMGIPPSSQPMYHASMAQQQVLTTEGYLHHGMHQLGGHEQWAQAYVPQVPPGLQHPPPPPPNGGMDYYLAPPPPPHSNTARSAPHTPRKAYPNRRQGQDGGEGDRYAHASPSSDPSAYSPFHRSSQQAAAGGYHSHTPRTPLTPTSATSDTAAAAPSFASLIPSNPLSCSGLNSQNMNPNKNQLDLVAIEKGIDTRTTVMVKNIPNKMSDRDLLEFIGRVCPRRIDFLYLRMDFQNGCNVGYAFVNFITVQDLLHFASTQLGVKWNMYSSEKVLQMSYANYQGKEALVEKFKNSCIMDEREAWRPKIFYSSGPNQGLSEPFPAPTHLRRKERSAHNRGALFVPGPGSHHHQNQNQGQGRGGGGGYGGGQGGQGGRQGDVDSPAFRQYPPRMSTQ